MKMMHNPFVPITVLVALALAGPVHAQKAADDHAAHHPASSSATAALPLIDGEVRRIDKSAGKLTVKHAAIPNLDMPPMTMVYRVKAPDMLSKFKPGDKVKFSAEKVDGAIVITDIQAAN